MQRPPSWKSPSASRPTFRALRDARRYDGRWAAFARAWLREHPVCDCGAVRVWVVPHIKTVAMIDPPAKAPAACVDHIRPLNMGGAKYDERNLQSLCWSCHSKKTAQWG